MRMFRQPHGSGQPPPPPPDEGGGRGGDLDNRNIHRSIPINNDPAEGIEAIEVDDSHESSSVTPSFALLSALRHRNTRVRTRQRRRDSKSPHPALPTQLQPNPQPQLQPQSQSQIEPQPQQQQTLTSTPSSSLHQPTPFPPNHAATLPFHSPLASLLALPPAGSAFLHHRSRDTKQPKQPRQRRPMPYPLNASTHERSPSHSPPPLPSPPPSAPSVAETPRDVEQLAGEFSRQHLERTSTTCFRGTGGSISISASGSVSGSGSGLASRNGSRYGDAFAAFSPSMAEFRLRRGGNEPVMDLEVDMDQDNRNDEGDCMIRPPSPSPLQSTSQFEPSSSYAASVDYDAGPVVPLSLQRMRMRQIALADASVRHLDLGLKPFARQISPETDASQEPQQANVVPTPPAEAILPEPSIAAATSTSIPAVKAPTPSSTGAAALAAADPIEADDDELAPLPQESMAMLAPFPQRSFHLHSHSYSRSYYSQAASYSRSMPHSRTHSRQASVSTQGGTRSSQYLPLSHEALAMPHLAPLHNDVPSSGYDMQGWLSSSSTVETGAALTTGTIDNCSEAYPVTTSAPENNVPAATTTDSQNLDTSAQSVVSNNGNQNGHSRRPSSGGSASVKTASQASERRQQSKQFYTAYLRSHELSYLQASGAIVPVDALEADAEDRVNTGSVDGGITTIPEESTPVSGSGSATVSHATNQGSAATNTQSGQYMATSQRIRLIQMAMAREAGRIRSEQSANGTADGSSTNDSGPIVPDDRMDVEMADPTAIESSYAGSAGLEASINGSLIGAMPPLWDPHLPDSLHKYMGPFRYRLSSEIAAKCSNLVHSKPRMRRRRQPGEGSQTNDGGSSRRSGSIKDGSSLHSERRSERRRERHRERAREREAQAGRDPSTNPSGDLAQAQAQSHDGRERRSRSSRHRDRTRLTLAQVEMLDQKGHVSPLPQPSPPPDPLLPPVPDPALMQVDSQQQQQQQNRESAEQQPLPVFKPPVPEPIDAAVDMS